MTYGITRYTFLTVFLAGLFSLCGPALSECRDTDIEQILEKLNESTAEVESYASQIKYVYRQPILDSQTLRQGKLYFINVDDKTKLRIDFDTLQQDDSDPQPYRENYIFDGVWLAQIDYRMESARLRQMAHEDEPASAFELARQNFPIIGFDEIDQLKEQFDISLLKDDADSENDVFTLHLAVKADSQYADDYQWVRVGIDQRLFLPAKIVAETTEGDIYQFDFIEPEINTELEKELFEIEIPDSFPEPDITALPD